MLCNNYKQLITSHLGSKCMLEAFRSHVFVLVRSSIFVSVQITLLYLLQVCQSGPVQISAVLTQHTLIRSSFKPVCACVCFLSVLQVGENFVPPLLDAVLIDYQRNVPAAREPEVLSTMATIVNKLGGHITGEIPQIFDAVFECTLNMINKVSFPYSSLNILWWIFNIPLSFIIKTRLCVFILFKSLLKCLFFLFGSG